MVTATRLIVDEIDDDVSMRQRRCSTEVVMRNTLAAAFVLLSACSSSGKPPALQPADSVRAAAAVEGQPATIGQPATLDKLKINMSKLDVGGDESGPWLTATVHVENAGSEAISVSFEIHCTGKPDAGGWQASSTYTNGDAIPPGTFDDGTINLLLPGDSRTGAPRPKCAMPAKLVAQPVGLERRLVWDIPDELVDAMNGATITTVSG